MTSETYVRISEIYHQLLQNDTDPVVQNFKKYSGVYWHLPAQLSQEAWQTVNDCFCFFHDFSMAMLAAAIEDTIPLAEQTCSADEQDAGGVGLCPT